MKATWVSPVIKVLLQIACTADFRRVTFPGHWKNEHVCCRVWLYETPWTVAHKLLCSWNCPGKNTVESCQFLLQGIFQPRDWTLVSCVSCIWEVNSLPLMPTGKPFPEHYLFLNMQTLCFFSCAIFARYMMSSFHDTMISQQNQAISAVSTLFVGEISFFTIN